MAPRNRNIPLTYPPKIPKVIMGDITHTIRREIAVKEYGEDGIALILAFNEFLKDDCEEVPA